MRIGLAGLLAVALPLAGGAAAVSAGEAPEAKLGPRVTFPGFSLQVPEGYEGPNLKRERPATYLSWTGRKRTDLSQPLFLITVTDIDAAPAWTGYAKMTLGELTDYFVQEIARNSVGFQAGDMRELDINGITFRQVPYRCQIKNNAMELVPMSGWVMITREGGYLYTLTASDAAKHADPTLAVCGQAAGTFRWEDNVKPPATAERTTAAPGRAFPGGASLEIAPGASLPTVSSPQTPLPGMKPFEPAELPPLPEPDGTPEP